MSGTRRRWEPSWRRGCARRARRKFSPHSVPDARAVRGAVRMPVTSAGPLANRGIVVTRPAHQAAPLAEMIRAAGGRPILFPVIEIAEIDDTRALNELIDRLGQFDPGVFV